MKTAILLPLGLLALSLSGPVHAGGVEITDYGPLKEMSMEAADVRQQMQSTLLTVSVGQARLEKAREAMEEAASTHGTGSNDYRVAEARFGQLRREILGRTLDQLESSQRRLDAATNRTGHHVQRLVGDPARFRALVRGHLKDRRNPEITAVILHMAIQDLQRRCEELYSKALVGQLEADLSDIEQTLKLMGELGTPGSGRAASLEDAWARFSGDVSGLAPSDDGAIDDLDRMLP